MWLESVHRDISDTITWSVVGFAISTAVGKLWFDNLWQEATTVPSKEHSRSYTQRSFYLSSFLCMWWPAVNFPGGYSVQWIKIYGSSGLVLSVIKETEFCGVFASIDALCVIWSPVRIFYPITKPPRSKQDRCQWLFIRRSPNRRSLLSYCCTCIFSICAPCDCVYIQSK